jgi:hypothetical protein
MTAAGLVPTGRVTHCCAEHADRRHLICCDPVDCLPCCPECPTCPKVRLVEQVMPGFGKCLATAEVQLLVESRDRGYSADAADALWSFDQGNPHRLVIDPPIKQVVNWFHDVQLGCVKEPF